MKLLAATLTLTAACAVTPSSDPSAEMGTDPPTSEPGTATPRAPQVQVLLTDAPGDFEAVWVTIASVEIEAADGWLTLTDQAQRFDLLTLQNDVTAALGEAALAPGAYGQLRLIVDEASVVVDGVESPLAIASGAQTGIKINLDATLEPDTTYALTLDYDAHKSVKTTGQGYLMTPVISVKELTATPMPPAEPEPEPEPGEPLL